MIPPIFLSPPVHPASASPSLQTLPRSLWRSLVRSATVSRSSRFVPRMALSTGNSPRKTTTIPKARSICPISPPRGVICPFCHRPTSLVTWESRVETRKNLDLLPVRPATVGARAITLKTRKTSAGNQTLHQALHVRLTSNDLRNGGQHPTCPIFRLLSLA